MTKDRARFNKTERFDKVKFDDAQKPKQEMFRRAANNSVIVPISKDDSSKIAGSRTKFAGVQVAISAVIKPHDWRVAKSNVVRRA